MNNKALNARYLEPAQLAAYLTGQGVVVTEVLSYAAAEIDGVDPCVEVEGDLTISIAPYLPQSPFSVSWWDEDDQALLSFGPVGTVEDLVQLLSSLKAGVREWFDLQGELYKQALAQLMATCPQQDKAWCEKRLERAIKGAGVSFGLYTPTLFTSMLEAI